MEEAFKEDLERIQQKIEFEKMEMVVEVACPRVPRVINHFFLV